MLGLNMKSFNILDLGILCLAWAIIAGGGILFRYGRSRLWLAGALVALAMFGSGIYYAINTPGLIHHH